MKFSIFLKGMLMGFCDLVPGISGGTIAFITGIYERLITSVHKVLHVSSIVEILSSLFLFVIGKESFVHTKQILGKKYDLGFLLTLFCGIGLAIFAGSHVILFLLSYYFVFTMSFFVGLIVASCFVIYRRIERGFSYSFLFLVFGFCIGFLLLFLVPVSPQMSLPYVFLSGFIGIMAMFLPGISGSFLLYIMGSYEYVLLLVSGFSLLGLFVFLCGAVVGASVISRVITHSLKYYHSQTLYFLLGFVFGALFIPLREIYVLIAYDQIALGLLFFLLGVFISFILEKG